MRAIRTVTGTVTAGKRLGGAVYFNLQLSLGHRQKFTRAVEMRRASQLAAMLEPKLVKFDVLFEMQW